MKRITWAVLVAAGFSFAVPAYAEDPPATESGDQASSGQGSGAAKDTRTSSVMVEETRNGAGSMEPAQTETDQERVEREFVESIWNSP
jgi:hypothetical protein